jgi:hypothetical protein
MLLTNYIVEEDLKNVSVGTVVDIIYDSPGSPTDPNSNLLYIVVDFPHSTVPPDEAWDSSKRELIGDLIMMMVLLQCKNLLICFSSS